MSSIYIAFVDTPGIFASIIRFVLKQKYIHVVIGMDETLEEAYSFGRRNPFIPFFAGFEKEDKRKILKKYPTADYMVCRIACSAEQRMAVYSVLQKDYHRRFHYHYAILGLPFILCNKPFQQKNHYTCSSYLAKLLEHAGICCWKKHTSLVTPKDFYCDLNKEVIFEGTLFELVHHNSNNCNINTRREISNARSHSDYGTNYVPAR